MKTILEYLNKNGEKMDIDIAAATGLSLAAVKSKLRDLSLSGAVISCNVTRFVEGVKIEGISSRVSGSIPQPSPGRKPKTETATESS
ncbi:MAG: ArsR family transcriptional regulator [Methylophilaceae bacterium]|jgi:hydroxymethylpyrimidine pyrophosphatase-like HAD family hydrolase|nr:ArsR family transcriptional regulator [Methyloradius sp.]